MHFCKVAHNIIDGNVHNKIFEVASTTPLLTYYEKGAVVDITVTGVSKCFEEGTRLCKSR